MFIINSFCEEWKINVFFTNAISFIAIQNHHVPDRVSDLV